MSASKQMVRFVLVGLVSNAILYLLYLLGTYLGVGPKATMTTLYALGVAQTFIFNKNWTFGHEGAHGVVFMRYVSSYGLGYVVNLLALLFLVDRQNYPHQIVQGAMIVTLAGMLFLLQKYWVFRPGKLQTSQEPQTLERL